MSKISRASRRKQNLELIRSLRTGKAIIKPWEGMTIMWIENDNGKFCATPFEGDRSYIVSEDERDELEEKMGGVHVLMAKAKDCAPIGNDPDIEIEKRPGFVERIKNAVNDLFHPKRTEEIINDHIVQVKIEQPRFAGTTGSGMMTKKEDLRERYRLSNQGEIEEFFNIYMK